MLPDITYIGDGKLEEQLGCPVATHGCFYSFADDAGGHRWRLTPRADPGHHTSLVSINNTAAQTLANEASA